jgi:translocon-associated protein subunit alpha
VYLGSVFNKTVPVVEVDEGLDGETFFLYLFMLGLIVLLCLIGHNFLVWGRRKTGGIGSSLKLPKAQSQRIETGTRSDGDDIDFDWLPREALKTMGKKGSAKKTRSPKSKKAKKFGQFNEQ